MKAQQHPPAHAEQPRDARRPSKHGPRGEICAWQTLEALADDRLRIGGPAGERDEAAVHVEGCVRARAAVVVGRGELNLRVVELEGLAC